MGRYQSGAVRKSVMIILAVLGLMLIGWVVWLIFLQPKAETNAPQATSNGSQVAEEKPVTDTTKYLVIKEWGVKLPLSDAISDATYYLQNGEVFLGTSMVQAACIPKGAKCSVVTLSRSQTSQQANTVDCEDAVRDEDAIHDELKIGDYYYQFDDSNEEGWRYQFAASNTTAKTGVIAVQEAFVDSFQGLAAE